MIWKRKEEIASTKLGPISVPPVPARKEFETMLQLLIEAEKFDMNGESFARNMILSALVEYIEQYKIK